MWSAAPKPKQRNNCCVFLERHIRDIPVLGGFFSEGEDWDKSSSCSRVGLGCMAQDVGFMMRGAGRSASPSALLVGFPSPYLVKDSKCACDPLFRSLPCAELRMCCFGGTWAVGMWKMRRVIMTLREVVVVLALILRRGELLVNFSSLFYSTQPFAGFCSLWRPSWGVTSPWSLWWICFLISAVPQGNLPCALLSNHLPEPPIRVPVHITSQPAWIILYQTVSFSNHFIHFSSPVWGG